ncbi:P110/LppT family adhesin N-terminal domain [Mesomycoplasma dispar]|uniref:P102/LppT family protein n=1 Tax=Mesomycoplasma dispar TaxID=86660 RepID=A0ABM6PR97_9BACT|nr:P110/LppT family adhesin N-terminal domain [Mesomycoplasma dispar]ATP59589.1 hypothetical protein CSW10_01355 [Mesomycoplasma dispar]
MKKLFKSKQVSRKNLKIIVGVSLLTLITTLSTAIPLGIWSYNSSYYGKLNEKAEILSINQTENPFTNNLAEFSENLVIKENFRELSAETAFELAKSKIYNLDLLSLVDLEKLHQKKYQISYDLSNAAVSKNSIKNVVLFVKTEDKRQVFSKAIEIKGFSNKTNSDKNLSKFEIDEKKSSIVVPAKNFLSFPEFKSRLQSQFEDAQKTEVQKFRAFEKALVAIEGSYSLINTLGLPSFMREGQVLEPKITGKNLNFSSVNGKNFLNFTFDNVGKKTEIQLEINGLISEEEIKNEVTKWTSDELENEIKLKPEIQQKLVNENLSLSKTFYSKEKKINGVSTNQNFSDLFNHIQSEYSINTAKLRNYSANNIVVKVKKIDEISEADRSNLLKDGKIRLDLSFDINKKNGQKLIKIFNFKFDLDLKPDLNQFSRIFVKNLPEEKTQVFSLKKADNSIAISSEKLISTINEIKDLSNQLNPENPNEKLVENLYLLDFGKKGNTEEEANYKKELVEIAKKLKTETVKVQTFADGQSENTEKNDKTLGKTIWKALNLQHNLASYDVKSDFSLENKDGNVSLEFTLFSNKNNTKLASTKIQITGIVSSTHSAFDVASKFYPTFFLDGKASFTKSDDNSEYKINDLSDNNLKFEETKTGENKLTQDGFEIKKAIKFSQNAVKKVQTSTSGTTSGQKQPTPAPFSRLDSGVIYFAFKPKNINDYKKHYLLSGSNGNGLFIQKVARSKFVNKINSIGVVTQEVEQSKDKKTFTSVITSDDLNDKIKGVGKTQTDEEQKKLDGYVIGFDLKQVKDFKTLQSYFYKNRSSLYISSDSFSMQLIDKQTVVLGPNSWKPTKNFTGDIVQNTGFPPHSEYRPVIEVANRLSENRFYRQELKNSNPVFLQNVKPVIDEDQNIVLEIIKTPWSIEINAFSTANNHLNSPSSVSLNGKTIYNVNPITKMWDPFPNYFNLDWMQIGPNPDKKQVETNTATSSGSSLSQESVSVSSQNDSNAESSVKKATDSKSSIIIKGLAVYNDPQLTGQFGSSARDEIRSSFINAYLK